MHRSTPLLVTHPRHTHLADRTTFKLTLLVILSRIASYRCSGSHMLACMPLRLQYFLFSTPAHAHTHTHTCTYTHTHTHHHTYPAV